MIKLDTDYYSLYDNKLFLFIDSGNIEDLGLKKIGSGTEADIYILNNKFLIKIYKEELLEEKSEIYNEYRIEEIAKKRNKVKNTNLVFGPVYINGDFKGVLTYNHRFAFDFNHIGLVPNTNYKINRINEVNENLKELEKNGLYHIDITPNNILILNLKTSKIIDTDGKSIRLEEDRNNYYSYRMYGGLFDVMLMSLFDFDLELYQNIDINQDLLSYAFKNYNINSDFFEEIKKEKFNYELLRDFLYYLKKDKVLSKKIK